MILNNIFNKLCAIFFLSMFLYGCEYITDEEYRDRGASDGYAVGYNTTCKIRATLTYGYDNKIYKEAYSYGYAEGAEACQIDQPEKFYRI